MLKENGGIRLLEIIPVEQKENLHFHCTLCGDCCRHVKLAVMLESLDVYRLAQHLHKNAENILMDYAEPQLLDEYGYPIFLLKTVGADDACIFLKEGRCTVYPARPRTCRIYPFTMGPEGGELQYFLCPEKPHHFATEAQINVGEWLQSKISSEDLEFLDMQYSAVVTIGRLLHKANVPQEQVMRAALFYHYFLFDTDKPFLPQYERNSHALIRELTKLAHFNSSCATDKDAKSP